MSKHTIYREPTFTLHVTEAGAGQVFLVIDNNSSQAPVSTAVGDAYEKIGSLLKERNMEVVHERIFASMSKESEVRQARAAALIEAGALNQPCLTYLQGQPIFGEGFAGALLHAVQSSWQVETVLDNGLPRARRWQRDDATYIALHSFHGAPAANKGREAQAVEMFADAERFLRENGAAYTDVARTWLYLSELLEWYGELNSARDLKYGEFGLLADTRRDADSQQLLLPASTGIDCDNLLNSICLMDALVIAGEQPPIRQMGNEKQQDAFQYGSSFSRAACIQESDATRIELSGTASIDETGASVHIDDPHAQIEHTLDAVNALFAPANASLHDIAGATMFFKSAQDYTVFEKIAAARGLSDIAAVYVEADVCRDDLLYEMDGVAILPE
jgi:enamine deaminase RidA (YjgF/YER057c/UK114 family)